MSHWFQLGGIAMWPTSVLGILTIVVAFRYAVERERRTVPLVVGLGASTLMSGGLGFVTGLIKSLQAIPKVGPDERWIWLVGLGESLVNVALALALVGLATLTMAAGAWRHARQGAIGD